ncbi:MAG: BREX system P-loop protein BrxC, partial [Gemmatimonadetes bacterium]|nr:BREX system P-loop protein BrxC [Gemmatimonadota bacterium]
YDLVSGNIGSEIRGKISAIEDQVDHPLAQSVAKAICLLQYVLSIHRTAENIAATLHSAVDADSCLPDVKEALAALEAAHLVRLGNDGYRIPSPAEDDWERQRATLNPKPGDVHRIHARILTAMWQPAPQHSFLDTKVFRAGLFLNGRAASKDEGDIPVHLALAEAGQEFDTTVEEMRIRSQTETKSIFWVAALDGAIDRETVEVFRSQEILSKKERSAQTKDETALVSEEKRRQERHQSELHRLTRQACLSGTVYFRGNDRSPDATSDDVGKTASALLAQALPEVYDRFKEAAALVQKKDFDVLMTNENLLGLTPVFTDLNLVRDENGKPVFNTDTGPLSEVLAKIENRANYGENATGRYLSDEFAKEPFGWDFDVVKLFALCLLRAGKIAVTSKGQIIESARSIEAQSIFRNNNLIRSASFQPKQGETEFKDLVTAANAFKTIFGTEISELETSAVATAIRNVVADQEEGISEMYTLLTRNDLPGTDMLQDALNGVATISRGKESQAIMTFNNSYKEL